MDGKYYTFSSDIWSIGMVVYEMAAGRHAYPENSNPLELCERIRYLPSPSLVGIPNLSNEITDFVSRWYYIYSSNKFIVSRKNLIKDPQQMSFFLILS